MAFFLDDNQPQRQQHEMTPQTALQLPQQPVGEIVFFIELSTNCLSVEEESLLVDDLKKSMLDVRIEAIRMQPFQPVLYLIRGQMVSHSGPTSLPLTEWMQQMKATLQRRPFTPGVEITRFFGEENECHERHELGGGSSSSSPVADSFWAFSIVSPLSIWEVFERRKPLAPNNTESSGSTRLLSQLRLLFQRIHDHHPQQWLWVIWNRRMQSLQCFVPDAFVPSLIPIILDSFQTLEDPDIDLLRIGTLTTGDSLTGRKGTKEKEEKSTSSPSTKTIVIPTSSPGTSRRSSPSPNRSIPILLRPRSNKITTRSSAKNKEKSLATKTKTGHHPWFSFPRMTTTVLAERLEKTDPHLHLTHQELVSLDPSLYWNLWSRFTEQKSSLSWDDFCQGIMTKN